MNNESNVFPFSIKTCFDETLRTINIYWVEIPELSTKIKQAIDKEISSIYNGENTNSIKITKLEMKKFLDSKDTKGKAGAISEFFIHLFLRNIGYEQECCFSNLEDNSFKKGFDGHYTKESELWIMESKSGHKVNNAQHANKINECCNDFNNKFSGETPNNPWKNAFSHSRIVGSSDALKEKLRILSNNFVLEKYPDISDFNLIPVSTIFFGEFVDELNKETINKIVSIVEKLNFSKLNILCINQKSIELFLRYLEEK